MKRKNHRVIHLCSAAILLVDFLLCRYVFFDLHGMKQWPVVMLVLEAAVLVLSFLLKGRYLPVISANGYLVGFVVGLIFQTDGIDPGGGRTNNLWLIWLVVWLGVSLIGGAVELFCGRKSMTDCDNNN